MAKRPQLLTVAGVRKTKNSKMACGGKTKKPIKPTKKRK